MRFRIKSTTEETTEKSKHFHFIYDVVQRKMKSFSTSHHLPLSFSYIRVSVDRDVSIDLLKCKDGFHLVYSSRLRFVMFSYLHSDFAIVIVHIYQVAESMCACVNERARPR